MKRVEDDGLRGENGDPCVERAGPCVKCGLSTELVTDSAAHTQTDSPGGSSWPVEESDVYDWRPS